MSRLARRVTVPVTIAVVLIVPLVLSAPAPAASADQDLIDLACSVPHRYLVRTWNGFSPDRGPELTAIPKEPDFMGAGLPHVGPWDYIQHIPMFWYGPGHIRAQGETETKGEVTLADVAPTQAELLHFDGFTAPDGTSMSSAIEPAQAPPKLIVVLVWDSAGINVLETHEGKWPYLESLIPKGTWYTEAYVGSSPTSTAQDHATLGTGAFPIHHGIIAHHFQLGGEDTTPWQIGPNFFVEPTFADVYDEANGNDPIAGIVATADIHLGMLGHGTFWGGGDRDIAMARAPSVPGTSTSEGDVWNLPKFDAPYFHLPEGLNDVPGFAHDIDVLDRADGRQDGKWRENDIEALKHGFDTPARTAYQERVVETVIANESFGADDVPDLLYVNFKEIDYVGHVWSMNSPEMADSVKYQDDALKRFVAFLNEQIGKDQWAMVITSDHAAMPNPKVSGGFEISTGAVSQQIEARFDTNGDPVSIVDNVQPGSIFLNEDEVDANDTTIEDIARFTQTLTQADASGGGVTPNPGEENDPVFLAVFPSSIMPDLPCLPEAKETSDIV